MSNITLTSINDTDYFESCKVEKILKGSLDLISSPSMKVQIMGGKICMRHKGKTLLGIVNIQQCFVLNFH